MQTNNNMAQDMKECMKYLDVFLAYGSPESM